MLRRLLVPAAFAGVTVVMGGCAIDTRQAAVGRGGGCEEAAGQGVASSHAAARKVALANLTYQAQDLKGFMVHVGYGAIAAKPSRLSCAPYGLGLGLVRCVATQQLCGR